MFMRDWRPARGTRLANRHFLFSAIGGRLSGGESPIAILKTRGNRAHFAVDER